MEKIAIKTTKRMEIVDLTSSVVSIVHKSGVKDGICVVYCPHTTSAIAVNENADPTVKQDIINKLAEIVPQNANYRHLEKNSDAHIKNVLIGPSITFIVENGKLELGTWQGVFFVEGDGPRTREVWVKVMAG
ncbi:MAG: secondary thiamine-phosphate synthase enzyme YjbQ [Proteobacteria bacterium]|nr:secondary thiamine-phosphate synthase enzyme YjbQ [Pseudomonadota bacterium]